MNFLTTNIMFPTLNVPEWVKKHLIPFKSVDEIPQEVISRISENLKDKNKNNPFITICVIAFNEEKNILNCLSSLSVQKSKYPIEIIVCNNNSTDRTQELLDRCGVKSILEKKKGAGFARQALLEIAKGKYILNVDADIIFPDSWAEEFTRNLENPGIVGVYNVGSFLPTKEYKRFGLSVYEILRDISHIYRGINRPELCVGGGSFGFPVELGRKVGFRTNIKRGEDGSMAFALKQYGKLKFLNTKKTRYWTSTRYHFEGKSLPHILTLRSIKEFKRFREYFVPEKVGYKDREENILRYIYTQSLNSIAE